MSILVKQHPLGKTRSGRPAADRSAEAPIAIIICPFNSLLHGAIEEGLTIYAAAFAALYLRLASLDFKLDTVELPLVFLADLSMSIAARNMRSAKPGVAGSAADSGQRDARRPRILRSWRFAEALRRRGGADECVRRPILSRPSSTDGGRVETYVVGGSLKRLKLSVRAGQCVALSFSAHRWDVHQHSRFYTSSTQSRHSLLRGPPRQLWNFGNRIGRLFAGKICCGNAIEVLLAWMMWRQERVASCIPADLNFSCWTAVLAKTESSP
jgi:hypothetical protein